MVALNQLQSASLSGLQFLVRDDDVVGGANLIEHKYPDKYLNPRYVEDNGLEANNYTLKAVLHGEGVAARFLALQTICAAPGIKTLRHPWLGTKQVKVKPLKAHRKDSKSGIIEVELVCLESSAGVVFPAALTSIAAMVPGLAGKALSAAVNAFAGKWIAPVSAISAQIMANGLSNVIGILGQGFGDVADMRNLSNRVKGEALSYVRQPEQIGALFEKIRADLFESDLSDGEIWSRLKKQDRAIEFERGKYQTLFESQALTPDMANRWKSLQALAETARVTIWLAMAQASVAREYNTADEVQEAQTLLTIALADNSAFDVVQLVRADLVEVHTTTINILVDLELQLPRVEQLEIYQMPASALAYQLYDSHERTQVLVDLNAGQNPVLFDGETQVLRNG